MFCDQCGAPLEDDARFCSSCGASAGTGAAQPAAVQPEETQPETQPTQMTGEPQPEAQPQAAPQPEPNAAQAAGATGDRPQAAPAQPQAAPAPVAPVYAKGCLEQAFADITSVKGVFARICQIAFLPALIAVVSVFAVIIPVVGWVICPIGLLAAVGVALCGSGYAIEWGRDLTRGAGFDVRKPLLRTSSLSLGVFRAALSLVLALVAWVPSTVFDKLADGGLNGLFQSYVSYSYDNYATTSIDALNNLLSSVLSLAAFAFSIFFGMIASAAVMHLAVTGRAESAFSLDKVWKTCKKQLGKLFCATVLAEILVFLAAFVVILLITLVFALIAGGALASYSYGYGAYGYDYGYGYSDDALSSILAVGGVILVIYLMLVVFVVFFSSVFADMLKFRALGHWSARYAGEWTHEDESDFVIYLPGDRKGSGAAAAAPAAQPCAAPVQDPAPAQAAVPAQPAAQASAQPEVPAQHEASVQDSGQTPASDEPVVADRSAEPEQPVVEQVAAEEPAADEPAPEQSAAPQNPFGPTDPGAGF